MLLVTFLCGSVVVSIGAGDKKEYRYFDYCHLALFKDGVGAFINLARDQSPAAYAKTLKDIPALSIENRQNSSYMLAGVVSNLSGRIERIKRVDGKTHDIVDISYGTLSLVLAGILAGVTYFAYKNGHQDVIIQDEDIKTSDVDEDLKDDEQAEAHQVGVNHKSSMNFALMGYAGMFAIASTMYGIKKIYNGLYNVHSDDQHLSAYTTLLEATKTFIAHITLEKSRFKTFVADE